MVSYGVRICPACGGVLTGYDSVWRTLKTKYGQKIRVKVRRFQCKQCKKVHRETPLDAVPYKQYEKEMIEGVLDGFITPDVLGFEDFPCEMTMERWKTAK